jgi:hypothetical protein
MTALVMVYLLVFSAVTVVGALRSRSQLRWNRR